MRKFIQEIACKICRANIIFRKLYDNKIYFWKYHAKVIPEIVCKISATISTLWKFGEIQIFL